jgi:hypothetical protein
VASSIASWACSHDFAPEFPVIAGYRCTCGCIRRWQPTIAGCCGGPSFRRSLGSRGSASLDVTGALARLAPPRPRGILPWFYFELKHRTMYYFYALPAEPFLVMAVVYVLGALINGPVVLPDIRG